MKESWVAVIAVIINAGAQLSMKFAGRGMEMASGLSKWFSPWLFLALALYGLSFLLVVRVLSVNPLSVATPVMAGGTFLLITLLGWLLLGETLGVQKLAGIGLIFIGIVLLATA